MIKTEARKHEEHLRKYCEERGIWFRAVEEHRPKLGKIEITISIKVDEGKQQ